MKDQMLSRANEICTLDVRVFFTSSVILNCLPNTPRPLLVGVTVADTGDSLIVMGGSAVCFSFGTFWNKGCFTLRMPGENVDPQSPTSTTKPRTRPWRYMRTVVTAPSVEYSEAPHQISAVNRQPISIPRMRIASAEHFNQLLRAAQPVILEQAEIGSCTSRWTTGYLKEKVGSDREVSFSNRVACLPNFMLS
jgi:tRNA wybutosine-synthesizing protein 4